MKQSIVWEDYAEGKTEFEVHKTVLVIRFGEDIDHHNALQIRKNCDKMIEQNNSKHLIFDFTGVKFMDSSGIGVIMGRYKKVIFIGGTIAAAGVGDAVNRILLFSGLYKIMQKYDNLEEALKRI